MSVLRTEASKEQLMVHKREHLKEHEKALEWVRKLVPSKVRLKVPQLVQ